MFPKTFKKESRFLSSHLVPAEDWGTMGKKGKKRVSWGQRSQGGKDFASIEGSQARITIGD